MVTRGIYLEIDYARSCWRLALRPLGLKESRMISAQPSILRQATRLLPSHATLALLFQEKNRQPCVAAA